MTMMSEAGGQDYWAEFQDSMSSRGINGVTRQEDEGRFKIFTIEPVQLNFGLEIASGIDLSNLLEDEDVTTLFKCVNKFRDKFGINTFRRAGFRLIILDGIKTNEQSLLTKSRSLFQNHLISSLENSLGEIKDLGIAVDGQDSDKLGYHFRMGPYSDEEAPKYFTQDLARSLQKEPVESNFICDIDFFESDFEMSVKTHNWCKPLLTKAETTLETIKNLYAN